MRQVGRASPGGARARNLALARSRAEAVRERLQAAAPGALSFAVVLVEGEEALSLDLAALERDLRRSGLELPDGGPERARLAYQSVQAICAGCPD